MASTYNSLGYQKMATGENAGTWGTKTNTTLDEIKETFGYQSIAMTADRTLTIPDGSTGTYDGRAFILELTGTLGGTRVLDIAATAGDPAANIEKPFIVFDNTTHSGDTLTFKVTGQTGFALTEGSTYLCYHNGTDIINTGVGASTSPGGSTTEIQFNNSGAFGASSKLTWDGTNVLIDTDGALRLGDNAGSAYVGLQAPTTITGDTAYTLKLPIATGAADQILVTDGSGNLSFTDNSGGTSWQAVVTGATKTAVAGEGYFIDTTSNECNLTLPAGALGNEVSVIDYAGTFDSNKLTITPASGERIQGESADAVLTSSVERSAFTLAYSGATQGWLLKSK
jgi:hypothetical protein